MFDVDLAASKMLSRYATRQVISAYTEEHRHYHNLDHLNSMLRWVPKDHPNLITVLTSILFHDFVYLPVPVSPGTNEALSIASFVVLILDQGEYQIVNAAEVVRVINATAYHTMDQQNLDEATKLVLDLDLQNFAQPWDEYEEGSRNVEKELTPIAGSREVFLKKQIGFLNLMLKRKQIYYLKTEWEAPARENIARSIILCEEALKDSSL